MYWKFALDRWEYETIVQTKDWKEPVDQGDLIKFHGVLNDLPSEPKGSFVSRDGYQKGAIDYALDHGILIYEFREADVEPPLILETTSWAHYALIRMPLRGVIGTTEKTIPKNMFAPRFVYDVFTPQFSNIQHKASIGWLQSEYPTTNVSEFCEVRIPDAFLHETHLYDEDRAVAGNLATVFQKLAMALEKEGVEQKRVTQVFEQPTFIRTNSLLIPYVKVDAVSVDVKIERRHEIRRGRIANCAQWVLRELNSGRTDWFVATPSASSLLPNKSVA